ncbi:20316_t:CDS:2, partial [Funneliformis geosporum]
MTTITETNQHKSSITLSSDESNIQITPSHPIKRYREDNRHTCQCAEQQVNDLTLNVNDYSNEKDFREMAARRLLNSSEENCQIELEHRFPNGKMPFPEDHIKSEARNYIIHSRRKFGKKLSDSEYTVNLADDTFKKFSDIIQSQ